MLKIILSLLIIIIVFIIIYFNFNVLKTTDKNVIKTIYQMVYDVTTIFEKNNLDYWADGGTLLGAVRHKGIIPWDDDADFGIFEKDEKQFLSLKSQLNKCGYDISKIWFGYKIFRKDVANINGYNYSFPFIDIITFKNDNGTIIQSQQRARDTWPNEYFKTDELLPFKYYKFGSFNIKGPYDYQNYFERMYGKDWNEVAYRQYDHQNESSILSIKVKLTDADRVPAQPTTIVQRQC